MFDAIRNAWRLPDLRRKVLFTLFILVIYRVASHIPVPGTDVTALNQLFSGATQGGTGQLLGLLDIFSGGALSTFSVVAMGVYPYITASIIMQLLQPIIPSLEALAKEGEQGRRRLNQYTHWMTIPLAALQGIGQASIMSSAGVLPTFNALNMLNPTAAGFLSDWSLIITLTAGTMFALWLGELISEQGIGSGVSIIIFGGIVAAVPQRIGQMLAAQQAATLVLFTVITVVTIVMIVYIQEGQRRIPVQYGKRVRGMKMYGGGSTHVPLRVNSAGMIPLIFAISILIFPGVIASYFAKTPGFVGQIAAGVVSLFDQQGWFYPLAYFLMTIVFTFFYTYIIFQQQNLSEVLQQQGGFIPGIRPGPQTTRYLNGVIMRITIVGAVVLGVVAVLPFFERAEAQSQTLILTSTGLLIVVGVVLDTMKQLEAQLLMRHYEGFIK